MNELIMSQSIISQYANRLSSPEPIKPEIQNSARLDGFATVAVGLILKYIRDPKHTAAQSFLHLACKGMIEALPEDPQDVVDNKHWLEEIKACQDDTSLNMYYSRIRDLISASVKKAALASTGMDSFVQRMQDSWEMRRDEARRLYSDIRVLSVALGVWPEKARENKKIVNGIKRYLAAQEARRQEAAAATAKMQEGKSLAVATKFELLMAARRIARDIAVNGPITSDDVTQAMQAQGYDVNPGTKKNNWKGSIFDGAEWVKIGTTKSRFLAAHGRQISMWALKSWLEKNPLNGNPKSSFDVGKMFREFRRKNPGADISKCLWHIGSMDLSPDIHNMVASAGDSLFGMKVVYINNGFGACIVSA